MQAKPASAKPAAAAAASKPAPIAPGKSEGAKPRTTVGQKKAPPVVKVRACVRACDSSPEDKHTAASSSMAKFYGCQQEVQQEKKKKKTL